MMSKSYTDKFKASVLLMLEAAGYPDTQDALQRVAEHVNVSAKKLKAWFDDQETPTDDEFDWMRDTWEPEDSSADLETSRQLARPKLHYRKEAKRQFVSGLKREALNELIPALPPPDTDLYIIGNGAGAEIKHGINLLAFDFGSFLPIVVGYLGDRDCIAYVSTWTANRNHVKSMLEMLDDGRLKQLTVITDPYFKRREAAICNELITGLLDRHQRFLAFKNHVKCIALEAPDGRTCVITGSANLSAQPRCEQYVMTTAPDVYQFFVSEFFEEMLIDGR